MKAPNLVSILVLLGAMLPGLLAAFTQQYPPAVYWWAALVAGVLSAAIKAIEVYLTAQKSAPPLVDTNEAYRPGQVQATLVVQRASPVRAWLVG